MNVAWRDSDDLNLRQHPAYVSDVGAFSLPSVASRSVGGFVALEKEPMHRVAWKLPNGKRLVVWHSPHAKCGIAEYGRQLDTAMALQALPAPAVHDFGDVFLVHYEPALISHDFEQILSRAGAGSRAVLCCHYADETTFALSARAIVLHRPYVGSPAHARVIPLGCPVYTPSTETREELRARLGLPVDARILTTVGFLTFGKCFPEVAGVLLSRLPPNSHLQLICTPHFSHRNESEEGRMANLLYDKRVTWIREFISERELLDRVAASDLGYRYTPGDTGSVSAAAKQFISARCPVVVSGSTHTADIHEGVRRVPGFDIVQFATEAGALLGKTNDVASLRAGAVREYERLNMKTVAKQYVDLFEELTK